MKPTLQANVMVHARVVCDYTDAGRVLDLLEFHGWTAKRTIPLVQGHHHYIKDRVEVHAERVVLINHGESAGDFILALQHALAQDDAP